MANQKPSSSSHISENKNARRNYELLEVVEAGLVLTGTEVKSIRAGGVHMNDAYGIVDGGEVYLVKMQIAPYSHGNIYNHDPFRKRKLLLHKHQIRKLIGSVTEKGHTIVPVRLYWVKGRAKVELALARGKTKGDRRDSVKKRDAAREMDQAKKRFNN